MTSTFLRPLQPTETEAQGLFSVNDEDQIEINESRKNRISTRDVNKRIQSYLNDSDENCQESATLVLIVVLGLILTGTIIGFIGLSSHSSTKYKGSHTHIQSDSGSIFGKIFENQISKVTAEVENYPPIEETIDVQPLYRNDLLQTMYSDKLYTSINSKHRIFKHISVLYGYWIPTKEQLLYPFFNDKSLKREIEQEEEEHPDQIEEAFDEAEMGEMLNEQRRRLEEDVLMTNDETLLGKKKIGHLTNGETTHIFEFPSDNKKSSYDNNWTQYYCYLIKIDDIENNDFDENYGFKVELQFSNFAVKCKYLEQGFDYVELFINSEETNIFTGVFKESRVIEKYLFKDDFKRHHNNIEICYIVSTDESVTNLGFSTRFKISYLNPNIITWTGWNDCFVAKSVWRNVDRWDGSCGIGITNNTITNCKPKTNNENNNQNIQLNNPQAINRHLLDEEQKQQPQVSGISTVQQEQQNNNNNNIQPEQVIDELEYGYCQVKENTASKFCIKKNCFNAKPIGGKRLKSDKLYNHFNGIGRIDPSNAHPNPFEIIRSNNDKFDINTIINSVITKRNEIKNRHKDERILTYAVTQWNKLDDSKLRLGIKMARSLLLGDFFTVSFTGSSNTAGHDNLFLSSYPMQLQSLMRTFWADIGYEGAAFVVKNHAIGGHLGTKDILWCIKEIVGRDADVVFWEEIMNDGGRPDAKKMENHIRNSISLPRRPVWHSIIAGSERGNPSKFTIHKNLHTSYSATAELYNEYGSGIVEFHPSNGINPATHLFPQDYTLDKFYVTWHPGPQGHRLYAEIIGYFYLDSLLFVLNKLKQTIIEMDINKPNLELYNLLKDPASISKLPQGKYCKPICTSSLTSFCISGAQPFEKEYQLNYHKLNTPGSSWEYKELASNPQSLTKYNGGQASIDRKFAYSGNSDSGPLLLNIKVLPNSYKYVMIHRPYSDWGGLDKVLENMRDWLQITIDGSTNHKCMKSGIWTVDNKMSIGCVIQVSKEGKHTLAIKVNTKDMIPIWTVSTY